MPVALHSPGVYIQELPAGTRTITGVSTSLTAFVGRARRGPVNHPVRIFSFAEYERSCGGLWAHSPMSQAIRQYFLAGGAEALVVRVVNDDVVTPGAAAMAASVVLPVAGGRMTVRATAPVALLPGFDHLTLQVAPTGATTFDLTVVARDAAGAALTDPGGDFSYTVSLDSAGDMAGDLAAAVTGNDAAITLVELVGAAPQTVPDAGTVVSYSDAGVHYATLSETTGMAVQATAGAIALAGFARLELQVVGTGADTFDLTVTALDASGVVLDDGGGAPAMYTVAVDVTADVALALASGQTGNGVNLATLIGAAMTVPPTDGLYVTQDIGGTPTAQLVVGLRLIAPDEGAWGNGLRATVSVLDADPGAFHLHLTEVDSDGDIVADEVFHSVTLGATDPRALDRVLATESSLARVASGMSDGPTADTMARTSASAWFVGGDDGDDPRITQDIQGSELAKTGIQALRDADLFNLLCIPLATWSSGIQAHVDLWSAASVLCEASRAVLIIDPPQEWNDFAAASAASVSFTPRSANAALYFPRVRMGDPLQEGRLRDFPPSGVVAGVVARTDAQRGVWKAPAGTEASLRGVPELTVKLTDPQQGVLNQLGINCLRTFPVFGSVVWGARTLMGADAQASQWKYLPVRRTALFLEESLFRGTKWAVFEPNDEPLWGQLRQSIESFMHGLFRQGAFAGSSARTAYFVKCDAETTTQGDINRGVVNVVIGFAPLKPAEFVIIKLQQFAGQSN